MLAIDYLIQHFKNFSLNGVAHDGGGMKDHSRMNEFFYIISEVVVVN